ncbi:MAG TPA: hypothetical protein VK636_05125 [Gemmatimonadaceae bacterium]|nr:hypothetical protein [Gemmatimonadaceae bacterium]
MRLRLLGTLTFAVVAALTISACASDNTTAPQSAMTPPPAASQSLLGDLLKAPKTITPLQRTKALPKSLTASAKIGILGGTIALPGAGLLVVVPPLAVLTPTTITVNALAGSNVAYEFSPHGLKFAVPLILTQDLRATKATPTLVRLGLSLGYFQDASHVTSVTELLNVNADLLGITAVSTVWHFSGYIFASGRDME